MGQPWSQIDRKAEDAFKAIIEALQADSLAGVAVVAGFSGEELEKERIECICAEAVIEKAGDTEYITGNYYCTMRIAYISNYGDVTREDRAQKEGELFDMLMNEKMVENLNNLSDVPDFAVLGGNSGEGKGPGWEPGDVQSGINGEHEVRNELTGVLYCRPSTPED